MVQKLQQKNNDKVWDEDVALSKNYYSNKYYANLQIMSQIIGKDKKWIIDIGSGNGLCDIDLMKLGYTVTALDFSKKSIDVARQNYKKSGFEPVEVLNQDFLKNTLESNKYDVAISYGVIEHFYDDGKRFFIREMLRIVKPGGLVIIEQPNKDCLPFTFMQKVSKTIGTWTIGFENDNNPREVRAMLKEIGFKDTDYEIKTYNAYNGYMYIPVLRNIMKALRMDTLENNMKEIHRGYCLLYVIRKPL